VILIDTLYAVRENRIKGDIEITYMDFYFVCPAWSNWVAIDPNGEIHVYDFQPYISQCTIKDREITGWNSSLAYRKIAKIKFQPGDILWDKSLEQVFLNKGE